MTISNILEHWATIYKPLSHKPEGTLAEQSFFRIRYIDLENIFSRAKRNQYGGISGRKQDDGEPSDMVSC